MTDERNPFGSIDDGEDEEEQEAPGTDDDNKNFVALRKDRNRLEKQLKAVTPELEELRSFKVQVEAEQRQAMIGSVLQQVGLAPSLAKLYGAVNTEGEVTPQSVAEFAKEYGLVSDETVLDVPEVEASVPGFKPFVGDDAPGNRKVSRVDWLAKLRTNPEEAQRLFKQGRVDLSDLDLS